MRFNTKYFFYVIAIVLILTDITLHILSFFPELRTSNFFIIFLLSAGMLSTFIIGIRSTKKFANKKEPMAIWANLLKGTPPFLKVTLIITIPYVFFNFFYSTIYLSGSLSAEKIENMYVLTSKGKIIQEISETLYFRHLAYEFRAASGHIILFQLIAITLLSSAINVEKTQSKT